MKENKFLAHALNFLLLIVWLGFFIHRDTRFAGSFTGGMFAITGSLLLLVPLVYSVIKRINWLKAKIIPKISLSTLLTIHIYCGFIGAVLVVIHTGHKFNGILATTLTAHLLIVVFSGYFGRYLLSQFTQEISDKRKILTGLEAALLERSQAIMSRPEERSGLPVFSGFFSRLIAPALFRNAATSPPIQGTSEFLSLAESISDVEFAIKTHERFKIIFSKWLKIHIVLSTLFYVLLFVHITGEVYLGLRWFEK